jgi:hypothetical protein
MSEIINLLGEEEKFIKAMTGLILFGVLKYIVITLLQDLNDRRKFYFTKPPAPAAIRNQPAPPSSTPPPPTTGNVTRPEPPAITWQR